MRRLLVLLAATIALVALPATAAAERPYDVALRAWVYGLPLLNQQRVIVNFPANQLINVTRPTSPAQKLVVLPNVDTLYTTGRLELGREPLVLHVPAVPGRYYTFQLLDAYTNSFAYVGSRTTGSRAGDYAIAGPRWRGRVPPGVRLIRSPTPVVWLLGRTLVRGPGDLPAVNAIQRRYELRALSGSGGAPLPALYLPGSTLMPKPVPRGLAFFDAMGRALRENPPPLRDRAALRSFARIGVGAGRTPSRAGLARATRAALSAAAGAGLRRLEEYQARQRRASRRRHNGWVLPPAGVGNFGTRYLLRAYISQTALAANVRPEAIYPITDVDRGGRRLDGQHRYVLRFRRGELPPVRAFWSLTMYGPDRFLVENPIARYAVGNRTPGLRRGRDGSLEILVQHDRPRGRAANWLPAPAGRFSLALRLYEPRRVALADRWPLPVVRRR